MERLRQLTGVGSREETEDEMLRRALEESTQIHQADEEERKLAQLKVSSLARRARVAVSLCPLAVSLYIACCDC